MPEAMPKDNADDDDSVENGRSIFVTVGTTLFDTLIEAVSSIEFLSSVSRPENGSYTTITIQYGNGKRPAVVADCEGCDDKDQSADGGIFDRLVDLPNDGDYDDNEIATGKGVRRRRSVRVRGFRFRPSLKEYMRSADLIISHAGAGSVMEGVCLCADDTEERNEGEDRNTFQRRRRKQKKLAVVINSLLMDDHQRELADAMEERGYLFVVPDPIMLRHGGLLRKIEAFSPVYFPRGDEEEFAKLLDEHMGFDTDVFDGKKRF